MLPRFGAGVYKEFKHTLYLLLKMLANSKLQQPFVLSEALNIFLTVQKSCQKLYIFRVALWNCSPT